MFLLEIVQFNNKAIVSMSQPGAKQRVEADSASSSVYSNSKRNIVGAPAHAYESTTANINRYD